MDVIALVRVAAARKATDLNLIVDSQPLLRIDGVIQPLAEGPRLEEADVIEALHQLTTTAGRETFRRDMELDFGYSVPGVGRLRCNAAQQFNGISLAIRLLPQRIPSIDELELPAIYKRLAEEQRGLFMVTGPTDSGKSTALAAMIHHLNTTGGYHIVTVEDPIEYVHTGIKSAVTQRELGSHTSSFAEALRHVLRQNPDVIMVGEIRDLDTAAAVLSITEAGHLVLSTSHAPSAPQAIERIVDLFPLYERHLSEVRLASLLVAVCCQSLVPRADHGGRIAAVEIMLATPAVRSLVREGKVYQLFNVMRTSQDKGMVSLDQALADLCMKGVITQQTALSFCRDREELAKLIQFIPKPARTKKHETVAPA